MGHHFYDLTLLEARAGLQKYFSSDFGSYENFEIHF